MLSDFEMPLLTKKKKKDCSRNVRTVRGKGQLVLQLTQI